MLRRACAKSQLNARLSFASVMRAGSANMCVIVLDPHKEKSGLNDVLLLIVHMVVVRIMVLF